MGYIPSLEKKENAVEFRTHGIMGLKVGSCVDRSKIKNNGTEMKTGTVWRRWGPQAGQVGLGRPGGGELGAQHVQLQNRRQD